VFRQVWNSGGVGNQVLVRVAGLALTVLQVADGDF
jgi:hypothetical protein